MKVSIAPCSSYDKEKVYRAVKKAVDDIGFEIKPGSNVLLKPNVLSGKRPDEAVTTHPSVVEAVCRILRENDCYITIGESSGWGSTLKNFEVCGIADVARKYNARLVSLSHENLVAKKIPGAKVLKETKISKLLFDADLMINMPKMKTHSLVKYTGAVKNLFGCIPGALKQAYHVKAPNEKKFCQLLVDIYSLVRPGLTIMDGVIGMEGNGPSGGTLKKAGLIIAGDDCASVDYVAGKIIGIEDVYTTRFAISRGLFNPDNLKIIGEVKKIRFRKPLVSSSIVPPVIREMFFKTMTPEPYVVKEKCVKCGVCMKVCQSKAIKLGPYPIFDRRKCIHCYCCHELCPEHAIDLRRKLIIEMMSKVKKRFGL